MLIHLHRHSRWSLLDGTGSGKQYAKIAAQNGQPAMALTDHGVVTGALEHYQACRDEGIWPIMGCEVYMRDNRLDHTPMVVEKNGKPKSIAPKRFHLTLLAMNYAGWLNLQRLVSEAHATGYYYKPCVDWDVLARYNEGIYCLGGCFASMISQDILTGGMNLHTLVQRMRSIYGDRFSLEIMPHDFDDQRILNIHTVNVANQYGIALSATGDAHYPTKDWAETQDVMLMLATKQSQKKRIEMEAKKKEAEDMGLGEDVKIYSMKQDNPTLYLMNELEMQQSFVQFHPQLHPQITDQAINNTFEIIKGFVPFMLDRDIKMPAITRGIIYQIDPEGNFAREASMPPGMSEVQRQEWYQVADMDLVKSVLRRWAMEGLGELKTIYPTEHWQKFSEMIYLTRINHELTTFDAIGDHVWRYMVMVGGEIRWARKDGIVIGPGRGSVAGSLVAYLSGITDIDPIAYDLMFERFTNENRKGMPDIDIDFMPGPVGRDRVKMHTGSVYGQGNVIDIAAYQTYGPRAALRAACRVFDNEIDFPAAERYAKELEPLRAIDKLDLPACAERFPKIAEFAKIYPKIWKHACIIEGHPFTHSEHASGVLVKPHNIEMATATRVVDKKDRKTTTAWPDTQELLASYGWLKIDYLVINGLVRQYEIMKALRERENTPIDLRRLPVRWDPYGVDPNVMRLFSNNSVLGVWQFEGKGTAPVLKAVKPDNMHDLAAINALIRPGPRGAGMTEDFARRKNGLEPITYWHESVEPVLKKTYGLMVYQEQMMEIAVQLGDFTRTEADDLRKAMGKKYREGKAAVIKFLDGLGFGTKFKHNAAMKVGEEMAIDIWENKCLSFGEYAFNASHAYAYALISYHDALFKMIAPADFYAWYLTFASSKDLPMKLSASLREGSQFGLKINPPDVNRSGLGFTVLDKQNILYGLESVKGCGPAACEAIFEARASSLFTGYQDFEARVPARACNKNVKKALIGSGAFDAFNMRHFMPDLEKASNEKIYIGLQLSGKTDYEKYGALIEDTINTEEEFDNAPDGTFITVGGEITGIKEVTTAKGDQMGFVNIAFGLDSYRVTLFPQTWAAFHDQFAEGRVFLFEGNKEVTEKYGDGFVGQTCISIEDLAKRKLQQAA